MAVPMADVTVVIPAHGASPHLPRVLTALRQQTLRPAAIIVAHSGSHDPSTYLARTFGEVRVLHRPRRMWAAAARNLASREVTSEWVACLDSDAIPAPDWLAAAYAAARAAPDRFVVGAIGTASEGGYWGQCLWTIEFSGVHPYLPEGVVQGGASANMLVRTLDIRTVGGFDETLAAGEDTLLSAALRAAGLQNWFCAGAHAGHVNLPGARHCLSHLLWLGRWSARCRRRVQLRGSAAVRLWPLAAGLWLVRLALIYGRVLRWGDGYRLRVLRLTPGIVLGLLVWNWGFLLGLAADARAGRETRQQHANAAAPHIGEPS